MKRTDAERRVTDEWRTGSKGKDRSYYTVQYEFFLWLETNQPALLDFRVGHGQDKWQTVRPWIIADLLPRRQGR